MAHDDVDKTMWCGNLDDRTTEEVLYELFLQAGPLERVKIATDKEGRKKNFSFITFKHPISVPYTIELMNGIRLFGRSIRLQARPGSCHEMNRQNSFNQRDTPMGGQRDTTPMGGQMNAPSGAYHRSVSVPNMGDLNRGGYHPSNDSFRERDRSRERQRDGGSASGNSTPEHPYGRDSGSGGRLNRSETFPYPMSDSRHQRTGGRFDMNQGSGQHMRHSRSGNTTPDGMRGNPYHQSELPLEQELKRQRMMVGLQQMSPQHLSRHMQPAYRKSGGGHRKNY